jgi:hypothetical protein
MRSEEKLEYLGEFDIIFEMNFRVWRLLLEKKPEVENIVQKYIYYHL